MSKPLNLRKKKLEKYFGILNEKEAQELWKEIKEMRKITDESINKKIDRL